MANPSLSLLQTDPSTWANPPAGKTYIGTNDAGQLVTKVHDGSPVIVASGDPSLNKQAIAGASATVTPAASQHTEVITVSGAARTLQVTVAETDLSDGAACRIKFILPATALIVIEVVSDGSVIWSFSNQTGAILKALFECYKDGGAWAPLVENVPAYTPAS